MARKKKRDMAEPEVDLDTVESDPVVEEVEDPTPEEAEVQLPAAEGIAHHHDVTHMARVSWRPWGAWGSRSDGRGGMTRCIVPAGIDMEVISIKGETVTLRDPQGGPELVIGKGMLHLKSVS